MASMPSRAGNDGVLPPATRSYPPSLVDATVYVGSDDGNLYAVDARSGEERWRFATGDEVFSSPVIVDGVVYIGSADGSLYAVESDR